ncbi:hypothetical protein D0Y65_017595, partial [Glycine soja]
LWYNFVLFDFWDRLTTVLNVLKNKDAVNNLQNCSYVDGEAATEEMKKSYHVLRKIE